MGAIGTKNNLLDIAKKMDPDGRMAQVAEVLHQVNPIVQDMPMLESNLPTGNRVTIRTGLPTVAFTRINQGTDRSKSTTKQRTDTIGILTGRSEFDRRLRHVAGGDLNAARWDEDQTFVEAMGQIAAEYTLYGDELTNDAAFTGLIPRYSKISSGEYAGLIVNGGGSGSDNTSIVIVDWGERTVHGIYPRGSKGGLEVRDLGEQDALDAASKPYRALVTDYEWALGLTLKNHKHVCRICNIDVGDLLTTGTANDAAANLIHKLIDADYAMDPAGGASRVAYCGKAVLQALDKMVLAKSNLALSWGEWAGQRVVTFRGLPIRRVDQFIENEAKVT